MDRRTLVRLSPSDLTTDAAATAHAVKMDSGLHEDGVELEYSGQKCTVSLARAAELPSESLARGSSKRGDVTSEQVWTPYIVPVVGSHETIDSVAHWQKQAEQAVDRVMTVMSDAGVIKSDSFKPMTILVRSCGLGALQQAVLARFHDKETRAICVEQLPSEMEISIEHLQRSTSGADLLRSFPVLAPGPSLLPRLGRALDGSVSLALMPLEATFLKPAAGVAYEAAESCRLLAKGGVGIVEFLAEHVQPHLGDGHGLSHQHHHSGSKGPSAVRGSDPACDLGVAYEMFGAGSLTQQGVAATEVVRLVRLAGCDVKSRAQTRKTPPGTTDLSDVGMVLFVKN